MALSSNFLDSVRSIGGLIGDSEFLSFALSNVLRAALEGSQIQLIVFPIGLLPHLSKSVCELIDART